MITTRPLEQRDAERLGIDPAWAGPSGGDVHRAGGWDGDRLVGAVQLTPMRRIRRTHVAELAVHADDPATGSALIAASCAYADRWSLVDRLELLLPDGHPAAGVAPDHGFAIEVRRVARCAPARDELGFARLRPGFAPRPPGPPPPWPMRHRRRVDAVTFRPPTVDDAAAHRDLMTEPTAAWGTVQAPWSNERFYAERTRDTGPDRETVAMLADGAVAGVGGVNPTPHPGVVSLWMAIGVDWQGCGLGARLLDHLVDRAWARGARRIELGVWDDNTRALDLYRSRGFVVEGWMAAHSARDGAHAGSLELAIVRG